MNSKIWGFTIIEVLVAVTIISLLSTLGMTGYQTVTRSGRDTLRRSDLEQIRSALEIYKSENGYYPPSQICVPTSYPPLNNYISPYPADPKLTPFYCYHQKTNFSYNLCARLENGSNSSIDCNSDGNATGDCGLACNYQVNNP